MKVLITGASKGIGFELVKKFAQNEQNSIIALARNVEELQALQAVCKKEYNNTIKIYSIDFLSENLKDQIASLISNINCHLDVVINNAGCLINKSFEATTPNDINTTFQTNVFAPMELMRQIIPVLDKKKWSHIVNIGSMGGYQGSVKFSGLSVYSASKAALANLTECLAEEYKERKIAINCLALGAVYTEMQQKAFPNFQAQISAEQMAAYIYTFSLSSTLCITGGVIPVSRVGG